MIHDAMERLRELDATFDPPTLARRFARDLRGDTSAVLVGRTDPAVAAVRADLVRLVLQPHLPTASGRPSVAADRRAARCHLSFDEGYVTGRLALNTHDLALLWSGAAPVGDTSARDSAGATADPTRSRGFAVLEAGARRRALRALVLSAPMTDAVAATTRVGPYLGDLTADTRGVPADQARQFAGFGFLTAACEWALVLDLHGPELEALAAAL